MKKRYRLITIFMMLLIGYGWLNGLRFNEMSAIQSAFPLTEEARVVASQPTFYGKAVLFEEKGSGNFGVALLEQNLWIFWRYEGGSYGEHVQEGEPFKATGFHSSNEKVKDQFAVGIKAADLNAKYVTIGNDIPNLHPSTSYEFTLREARKRSAIYQVSEVIDDYALFVADEYTEESWTIRAFDEEGKLIADKLFGAQPRYIDYGTW